MGWKGFGGSGILWEGPEGSWRVWRSGRVLEGLEGPGSVWKGPEGSENFWEGPEGSWRI